MATNRPGDSSDRGQGRPMLSLAAGLGAGSSARGHNPLQPRSSNIFEAFVYSGKPLGKQAPQAGAAGSVSSGSSLGSGSQGSHAAVPLAARRPGHQSSAGGPPAGAPETGGAAGEATSPGTNVAARPGRRAQRAVVIIDSDDEDNNPTPAAPSARATATAPGAAAACRRVSSDSPDGGLILGTRKRNNAHVLTSPQQVDDASTSTAQQHRQDAPRQLDSMVGGTAAAGAHQGGGEEKARQYTGSYFTDLLNDDIPDTAPPPMPPQPPSQPNAGGTKAVGSFSDFLMGKADDVRMVMAAPPASNGAGAIAQQQQQQQAAMLHHQQLIQQQLMQGAMQAGQGGVPIYQGRPLQAGGIPAGGANGGPPLKRLRKNDGTDGIPLQQQQLQGLNPQQQQQLVLQQQLAMQAAAGQRLGGVMTNPGQLGGFSAGGTALRAVQLQDPTFRALQAQAMLRSGAVRGPVDGDGADGGPSRRQAKQSLLERVEEISEKLKAKLGKGAVTDRFAGTSEDQLRGTSMALVTREQVAQACGETTASVLKGYQLVGINFLTVLSRSGTVGGAILADEMGLGKTAQTITFLGVLHYLAKKQWEEAGGGKNEAKLQQLQQQGVKVRPPRPHLVVCPASLIENWQRELRHWCPSLRVMWYFGRGRSSIRDALMSWKKRRAKLEQGLGMEASEEEKSDAGEDEEEVSEESEGDEEDEEAVEEGGDEGLVGGLKLGDPQPGELAPFDVLLTTYSMFERDSSDARIDRGFIKMWRWSHLVADEAHALKNRNSIRTKKLMSIARKCDHRVLLTGTPLQNDARELLNLLRFLMPSLFDEDAEDGGEGGEDELEAALGDDDKAQNEMADRMRRLMSPFILRRLKSEVAMQLVSKTHKLVEVEMLPYQANVYNTTVANYRAEVAAAAAAKAGKGVAMTSGTRSGRAVRGRASSSTPQPDDTGSEGGREGTPLDEGVSSTALTKLGNQKINNMFTHLRKIALHPLLVRCRYNDEQLQRMVALATKHGLFGGQCTLDRVSKEMAGWNDYNLHTFALTNRHVLKDFLLPQEAVMESAKCQELGRLLPELKAKGSRVLLFSQWTQMLDILEWFMYHMGLTYVRLDGNTQVEDRLNIVDRFNDPSHGIFAFLLSTRAGGQGLNLTGADTVILHDVDFNPQIDRQAEDRCHRLGQTRPVTVYRLVTRNTVDWSIWEIAQRKLKLDAAIMEGVVVGEEGEEGEGGTKKKTKSKKGKAGEEVQHMGAILAALLAGK